MDKDFNEIWSKNKLVKGRTIIGSILLNDNEIYLTGHTLGNFDEYENIGMYDVFLSNFNNKE